MIEHVAVVIPAANEQETICATLHAVTAAVVRAQQSRTTLTATVIVVLDRCADTTAEMVANWPQVIALSSDAGRVGAARAQGSQHALAHAPAARRHTWTAHTDADSVVPADWLSHQLDRADAGAELVLGTVLPHLEGLQRANWIALHDTSDAHRHVHGANLGIRADLLHRLGGWRSMTEHEDADLVERADRSGAVIARTGRIPVATSSRLVGRTPGGMAGYLRDLAGSVD